MPEWPSVVVGKHVKARTDRVAIDPRVSYPTMGVRWYGKGAYLRPNSHPKTKSLAPAHGGDFVFCRIDTQKGPFAIVPDDLDGALVTNEFPLFEVATEAFDPHFLVLCFLRPSVLHGIDARRNGRDGRARWREVDLESAVVPRPPLPVQRRIVEVIGAINETIETLEHEVETVTTLMSAVRQNLLQAAPEVPLSNLCSITARLVDPTVPKYSGLPHMGVDAIEKETGRILSMRSAKEDAVISGKFLVEPGQVVYSKVRPALRKACVPDQQVLCSADAYPLTPVPGVPAELLREALLEDSFTSRVVTASDRLKMPKVNRKQLFATSIRWPQPQDREGVVASLNAIRAQLQAVSDERDRLTTVRDDLLEALLNGEIDMIVDLEDEEED